MIGLINAIALVLFAVALCWRIDRLRREGGGLQPIAMTVSITAITLAFVIQGAQVKHWIDHRVFNGADRAMFYTLLAIGVAALIVVLFFGSAESSRQRRAGMEAAPLVIAVVGLNIAMQLTPKQIRTVRISEWSVQNVGFALFFIIAGCYLVYGLAQCVTSLYRYVRVADGYLRHALATMAVGLLLIGSGSLVQTVFVLLSGTDTATVPVLLTVATYLTGAGLVLFFAVVIYPMARARWLKMVGDRRHRRDLRTLDPLWRTVTEAIPAVVLPGRDGDDSVGGSVTLRYQRRVVEVRDALVQLSPCLPGDFEHHEPDDQVDWLRYALNYYREHGKTAGAVHEVLPGEGEGLDGDAAPLLRLSKALAQNKIEPADH
jgi:hypothetical protein